MEQLSSRGADASARARRAHAGRRTRQRALDALVPAADRAGGVALVVGPDEAATTQTTQIRTAATAHIARVKSRFNRPQSANSKGFIV
jgi:hypothetical protein